MYRHQHKSNNKKKTNNTQNFQNHIIKINMHFKKDNNFFVVLFMYNCNGNHYKVVSGLFKNYLKIIFISYVPCYTK